MRSLIFLGSPPPPRREQVKERINNHFKPFCFIAGQPDLTTCELDYTDDELDADQVSPEKQFRSTKRNLEVNDDVIQ